MVFLSLFPITSSSLLSIADRGNATLPTGPALAVVELLLRKVLSRVLSVSLTLWPDLEFLLVFNELIQELRVSERVLNRPGCAVLLAAPRDDLHRQRSHRFHTLRASADLTMYNTNRYTPRKAVKTVNTHSAGLRTASWRSLLAKSPILQPSPKRIDNPRAIRKFSFTLRSFSLPPLLCRTLGLQTRLNMIMRKTSQFIM